MPLYNFECADCGPFFTYLSIPERNRIVSCVNCKKSAKRVITAPSMALVPGHVRKAHAINERSRHEPRVSRGGHICKAGCSCGKPATRGKALGKGDHRPLLESSKRSPRPWMLGH